MYRRTAKLLEQPLLTGAREKTLREQSALIGNLRSFCFERHAISWSDAEAEAALLAYASDFGGPILRMSLTGEALPAESEDANPTAAYLVNSFIIHLHERDVSGFDELESIVKAACSRTRSTTQT